ncbi:OmpA family protein [Marinigracilibium pacificum]|uniref:OmpA family protein n=1 Tax=Marinigracilibium pacificum TaxID=2729599 RepID=A0A848J121_9BACT|nr:OmpA family protein [Marinigracilibium pacificum]NMM50257.1 OmpA family protein [Marinigracilibium pacificum]
MKNFYFLIFFCLTSCVVSKKKYDEALVEKSRLIAENAGNEKKINHYKGENQQLKSTINSLESSNSELEQKLSSTISSFESSLSQKERSLLQKESQLDSALRENRNLNEDLNSRAEKINELEAMIAEKNAAVEKIRNIVSNALLNFEKSDLTVSIQNGKVYVSLSEQLLFKSGSKDIDPKGIEAIKQLANVLKSQSDINIMVEGHTDNVPISSKGRYMNDNWDLSVMRATEVVRALISNGVDPTLIIASGRGEHHPISENNSKEGKSKNRRTEIILTPDLNSLYDLL